MDAAEADRVRGQRREPTDRFGLLLLLLIASFVLTGLTNEATIYAAGLVNAAVLVVAFRSTGAAVTIVPLVICGAVGLAAVGALVLLDLDDQPGGIAPLLQSAILIAVVRAVGRRVLEHRRVTGETLAGAICLYVLLGLTFAWIYTAMFAFYDEPALVASGGRPDPVYYSFVTLTTVGFGDVVSTIDLVRRISLIEAMAGQIFLATLVARLVSMLGREREGLRPSATGDDDMSG